MTNDELFEKTIDTITELFRDTSVSKADCKANLQALIDEITILLDSLEEMQ